jgi:hypothetical protein
VVSQFNPVLRKGNKSEENEHVMNLKASDLFATP